MYLWAPARPLAKYYYSTGEKHSVLFLSNSLNFVFDNTSVKMDSKQRIPSQIHGEGDQETPLVWRSRIHQASRKDQDFSTGIKHALYLYFNAL